MSQFLSLLVATASILFCLGHPILSHRVHPSAPPATQGDLNTAQLGQGRGAWQFQGLLLGPGDGCRGLEGLSLSFPEEERKMRLGVWVRVVRRGELLFALCNPRTQDQSSTNSLFDMVDPLKTPFLSRIFPLWGGTYRFLENLPCPQALQCFGGLTLLPPYQRLLQVGLTGPCFTVLASLVKSHRNDIIFPKLKC